MKRLIIVRHGNTFLPNQTPTRIGRRTDLPLVETELAQKVGSYLARADIRLNKIYAAPLKRTVQTAARIKKVMKFSGKIWALPEFLEIDYGPDENKPEEEVRLRLGKEALLKAGVVNPTVDQARAVGITIIQNWDHSGQVPADWQLDTNVLIEAWRNFAKTIVDDQTVLVVSSNGVIRFAPCILSAEAYQDFMDRNEMKVKTGSVSIFDYNGTNWTNKIWNKRP